MALLIPNAFSTYELSEEEEIQGCIFTIAQTQVLQNKLAEIAQEKLALEFDTGSPQEFIQQEAYKKGQLDLIQYLLDNSEAVIESVAAMANPESQQPDPLI